MESQNLKQRTRDESTGTGTGTGTGTDSKGNEVQTIDDNKKNKRRTKMVMAKRGLRSLIIAIALPLSLTFAIISFSGSTYGAIENKPFWYPPPWALHLASLTSSLLMGLSAWLVWANGGFHNHPIALYLYLAQLLLALSLDPITFLFGDTLIGLMVSMALFGVLVGCSQRFRRVNPMAGDLVVPCLAWVAFMTYLNFKLLYV